MKEVGVKISEKKTEVNGIYKGLEICEMKRNSEEERGREAGRSNEMMRREE